MRPLDEITPDHLAYWADLNPRVKTFAAPDGLDDCEPCRAVVTCEMEPGGDGFRVGPAIVRTPWTLSAVEINQLDNGGTLWLSTWGGLPPHMLEVQAPTDSGVSEAEKAADERQDLRAAAAKRLLDEMTEIVEQRIGPGNGGDPIPLEEGEAESLIIDWFRTLQAAEAKELRASAEERDAARTALAAQANEAADESVSDNAVSDPEGSC